MKNHGLKLEPSRDASKPWDIICFRNSDYTGNTVSRRSVSGFLLYVLGISVSWSLRAQRRLMLLSLDAEWVAMS